MVEDKKYAVVLDDDVAVPVPVPSDKKRNEQVRIIDNNYYIQITADDF